MVSGPPCQQCGYPLRWFPDQNAWGCDRCRQMFPAQQQMQQPMPVQPQMAPMQQIQGAPPRGGGKGLWIALGGVVVVGAIVAIVVATRGGKDNELDEVWMLKLRHTHEIVCACQDDDCLRTAMADLDKTHTEVADKMKLDSAEEKEQHELLEKIGDCVKKGPGTGAPPDQAKLASDMLRDARQLRDRACACKDMPCAAGLAADLDSFSRKYMPGFNNLPSAAQSAASEIMQAQAQCLTALSKGAAMPGKPAQPAQPAQPTEAAADSDDQPPEECARWKGEIDRMHQCRDFPKERAAAFERAYLQVAQSWKKMDREAVAAQCGVGAESVSDAVSPVCPE